MLDSGAADLGSRSRTGLGHFGSDGHLVQMEVGDVHAEVHLALGGADVDFDGDGLVTEALDRNLVLCRQDVVQDIITVNVSNGGDSQCGN